MCVGIGGSPEGVATACAIKALGGFMQGVLHPMDDEEKQRGIDAGLKFDHVYGLNDLVSSDNTFFVATGVTDGELVRGVRRNGPLISTESIVLRARSGTLRRVSADHQASKWLDDYSFSGFSVSSGALSSRGIDSIPSSSSGKSAALPSSVSFLALGNTRLSRDPTNAL